MKISKARREQLRRMREKHGLGEYSKQKRKVVSVARRRKGFFRRAKHYGRKLYRSASRGSINMMGAMKGVAFYGLYRAFLGSLVDGFLGAAASIAELAFGGLFLMKRKGWMRWLGLGMVFINGYKLFATYILPMVSGVAGSLGLSSILGNGNGNGALIG
jgi:hypothetical protein